MTRWYRYVRFAFWCVWMWAAAWAAAQWRMPAVTSLPEPSTLPVARLARPASADSSLMLLSELLDRMPFDNGEALALQADATTTLPDSLIAPDATRLMLSGIVDGLIPQAIVDGLPGTDGPKALRVGEQIGDVRLLEIDRERAVLAIGSARTTLLIGRSAPVPR